MLLRALSFAAFLVLSASVAAAGQIEYFVENHSSLDVTSVFASPGEISGFRTVRASQTKSFIVTLPDGVCMATVTAVLSDGQQVSAGKNDICTYNALQVTN